MADRTPLNSGTFVSAGLHAIVAVVMASGLFGTQIGGGTGLWIIAAAAALSGFIVDWFLPRYNLTLYTNDSTGFGTGTLIAASLHGIVVVAVAYFLIGGFADMGDMLMLFGAIGLTSIAVDFVWPRLNLTAA